MVLWPLYVLGATMQSRVEDELLAAKFGDEYRHYAARVGRFVPRLGILTPPRPAA
jgi:protein-S-isoprenylcysteine O-methyltransferase Ste14